MNNMNIIELFNMINNKILDVKLKMYIKSHN